MLGNGSRASGIGLKPRTSSGVCVGESTSAGATQQRAFHDMGGLERAPQAPRRSERPGNAVTLLDRAAQWATSEQERL